MTKIFNTKLELNGLKDWSITLSANVLDYNLSYSHGSKLSAGQDVVIDTVRLGLNSQDHRTELKNTFASSKSTKYSGLGLASFSEPFNYQFGEVIEKESKPYNLGVSYNWVEFNSVKSEGYGFDFSFEKDDNIEKKPLNLSAAYYDIGDNTGYALAGNFEKNQLIYGTNKTNGFNSNNIYLETFVDNYAIGYSNDDTTFNGSNVENQAISLGYNIISFLPPLAIGDEELFLGLKYNF
jgi:hypothetical protein